MITVAPASTARLNSAPIAPVLMQSLRAVGYTTPAAVADLVDNSIAAKARKVAIRFTAAPEGAWDSRCVELGLVRYPNSAALLSSRARALTTLRQINSQMNPFRFIVYSEWSGKALAPVSPQ
jgi:hypothetical protein